MFDKIVRKYGMRGKGYRFRDNKIIKCAKAIHILAAAAWAGGAFSMQALGILERSIEDETARDMVAGCSHFVDTWVVMPGLFGCIFTGLFYSIFTAMGFFKFAWIIYKWLVTASACFWGLIFWSGIGDKLVAWLAQYGLAAPLVFIRHCILPANIWATIMQTGIIFSMLLISVYRPVSFRPAWRQPDKISLALRAAAISKTDMAANMPSPLDNMQVKMLYENWLGEPLGPQSKKLLHTKFQDKSGRLNKLKRANLYPPRSGIAA